MRVSSLVMVALVAVSASACSSGSGGSPSPATAGGTGGSHTAGSGGSTGGTGGSAGSGGSSSAGGSGAAGSGVDANASDTDVTEPDSGADDVAADGSAAPADGAPGAEAGPTATGGEAVMVVGSVPGIGSDVQIHAALMARGLTVQEILDTKVMPADLDNKRIVVMSYSLDSKNIAAEKFADVKSPMIVMEHAILGKLGMTGDTDADHKWAEPATQITVLPGDSPLAAGFPAGDVTVYTKTGEVFWGVPSAAALKVASVKGATNHLVIFAYPAGAMMVGKPAADKRLQFFLGSHLVPDMWLNEAGIKLLDASIAWCLQ